ncbi:response regulator [Variovorax sp. IB41]|uniref:response regulator n=1 Tax=Variovorax sp. IB41 TaxID=2779370 RepID=UPI0018E75EBE|nr:response regulator [Variovorax sp. IB41]
MPTLIATFALVGLLRFAHVELPRWHLAFWFAVLVTLALFASLGWWQLVLNGAGSFLAAWAYFGALDATDNVEYRALHYIVLFFGMLALIGSRFWLDIRHYGIGL